MRKTLTIRTAPRLRRALEERARGQGKTVSEVAREILQAGLEERPLGAKTAHLRGRLQLSAGSESWRTVLRKRNWRE